MYNEMPSEGKVIRVSVDTYYKLKNAKYDLRVDTFDEVIEALLKKHAEEKEASA
jgi:predicted CopG family antitoxin